MPKKRTLTPSQIKFIQDNRLLLPSRKLADKIGCSPFFIQRFLRARGWQVPKEVAERFRIEGMTGRTTSTSRIDRFLRKHYLDTPEKRLADKIGKSSTFVRIRLRQLGLIVPPEIIEQRKQESRIKPGAISFNKGLKQRDFMSPAAIRRTKATRFKKGQLPKSTKHDLAITVRLYNRGVKQLWIRVAVGKWVPLHRYQWEQVHGPIAPRLKLIFKDRNTLNCNVDNLELVTPAELMRRNSFWFNYPKPLASIIQLRGALKRQINKHLKAVKNAQK